MPRPRVETTSTVPPSDSMVARTASMPTPRPEISDTDAAVESPAWKISAATCSGGRSSATWCGSRPASTARRRTASRSIPAPSSRTSIWIMSRSRRASISMRPASGLPASRRAAGASRPWSTALRSRCTSGSASRSRIERSSSSSAPRSATSTCLPEPLRDLARHPRQRLEDAQQRRGAQLERASLQLAHHPVHAVERRGQLARARRAPRACAEVRTWLECRITSPTVERKRSSISVRTRTEGGSGGASGAGGLARRRGAGRQLRGSGLGAFFFEAASRRGASGAAARAPARAAPAAPARCRARSRPCARGPRAPGRAARARRRRGRRPAARIACMRSSSRWASSVTRRVLERGGHALDRVRHPEDAVDGVGAATGPSRARAGPG